MLSSLPTPGDDLVAYSLAEASVRSGLSIATLYRRIGRGELETIRIGGRRLVTRKGMISLTMAEAT